jgi:hypothetical protein
VCPPNTYKEREIRFLKWILTPKHKEITSNKLKTTDVHSTGGEKKYLWVTLFNEYG